MPFKGYSTWLSGTLSECKMFTIITLSMQYRLHRIVSTAIASYCCKSCNNAMTDALCVIFAYCTLHGRTEARGS